VCPKSKFKCRHPWCETECSGLVLNPYKYCKEVWFLSNWIIHGETRGEGSGNGRLRQPVLVVSTGRKSKQHHPTLVKTALFPAMRNSRVTSNRRREDRN
jgi:hypothetical protein